MASSPPPDTNLGPVVLGITWAFASLSIITVAARLYVRTRLRPGNLGWDDWTMFAAFLLSLADAVFEIVLVNHGIGRHINYVSPGDLPVLAKVTLISSLVNTLGIMIVKISVCLFLLRMVRRARYSVLWLVYANLVILVPFTIATIIIDLVQCRPIEGYWNKSIDAKCISPDTINVILKVQSGLGVVTDFLTATIALFVISKLQMRKSEKITVSIILGLGYLVAVCSIVKTVTIKWTPKDYTWDNVPVSISGNVEFFGGIIVACIPTLRPLFPIFASKLPSLPSLRTNRTARNHPGQPSSTKLRSYTNSSEGNHQRSTSEEELVLNSPDGKIRKTTEVEVARSNSGGSVYHGHAV
ncbi:hypothetical protein EV356DRAFT_501509 [Viridothelium virens]|uniref:Rhodopsin domain-containing protein n=1 Tax=Viridothelium virens TaxID=1048519 RepID=A0A6A6H989_VIRVR|nr:hypothetical protein EV356DRAFT_501509 [Viridothelium virens]